MSMSLQQVADFEDLKREVRGLSGLRETILKAVKEALAEAKIPELDRLVNDIDGRVRKLEKRAPKPARPPMPKVAPPKILQDLQLTR